MTKKNPNHRRYELPEELLPTKGWIDIFIVVPPKNFDQFWRKHIEHSSILEDEPDHDLHNIHANFRAYITRLPFIADYKLETYSGPIELTADPTKLTDPALAGFIVAATQGAFLRATNFPNWVKLSSTTGMIDEKKKT